MFGLSLLSFSFTLCTLLCNFDLSGDDACFACFYCIVLVIVVAILMAAISVYLAPSLSIVFFTVNALYISTAGMTAAGMPRLE